MTVVGVDGCKRGWIAVARRGTESPAVMVVETFSDLVAALPTDSTIVVDMPIGLPSQIEGPGRVAEQAARKALARKASSVFSIPSRKAIYSDLRIADPSSERSAAYKTVCAAARATSTPRRAISMQSFSILPKIRQIDKALREDADLQSRTFESHPELAFCIFNGGSPLPPKKYKSGNEPDGIAQRRHLLALHGFHRGFLEQERPKGAGIDDFLDACAMLLVAQRIVDGTAQSFPDPSAADAFGIPVAIRV